LQRQQTETADQRAAARLFDQHVQAGIVIGINIAPRRRGQPAHLPKRQVPQGLRRLDIRSGFGQPGRIAPAI
jgi:hypothetical protein